MTGGLNYMVIPLGLSAMEIFLLHYMVWGVKRRERENAALTAALFVLTAAVRCALHDDSGAGSSGVYISLLCMGILYYLSLVFWLQMDARLSVYYLIIFEIPIDVCDLMAFMLMRMLGMDTSQWTAPVWWNLLYLAFSFVFRLAVLWFVKKFIDREKDRRPGIQQLLLMVAAVLPYLYMRNVGYWLPVESGDIGGSTMAALAVTAALTLIMVIGNNRILYYQFRHSEVLKLQAVMDSQREQWEHRREGMELVNQKYHDMRHQLLAIQGMDSVEEIHAYVGSLRREILPYEKIFDTGNNLMDVILADVMARCQDRRIRLLPTVDGGALSFLEAADLCTIFGNALYNAVEACGKLEKEERWITLKVQRVQGFLAVQVENSCGQPPVAVDGRLRTTKEDAANHGYGLEGIRHAVEKYQGEVETETPEGRFLLTILIPL